MGGVFFAILTLALVGISHQTTTQQSVTGTQQPPAGSSQAPQASTNQQPTTGPTPQRQGMPSDFNETRFWLKFDHFLTHENLTIPNRGNGSLKWPFLEGNNTKIWPQPDKAENRSCEIFNGTKLLECLIWRFMRSNLSNDMPNFYHKSDFTRGPMGSFSPTREMMTHSMTTGGPTQEMMTHSMSGAPKVTHQPHTPQHDNTTMGEVKCFDSNNTRFWPFIPKNLSAHYPLVEYLKTKDQPIGGNASAGQSMLDAAQIKNMTNMFYNKYMEWFFGRYAANKTQMARDKLFEFIKDRESNAPPKNETGPPMNNCTVNGTAQNHGNVSSNSSNSNSTADNCHHVEPFRFPQQLFELFHKVERLAVDPKQWLQKLNETVRELAGNVSAIKPKPGSQNVTWFDVIDRVQPALKHSNNNSHPNGPNRWLPPRNVSFSFEVFMMNNVSIPRPRLDGNTNASIPIFLGDGCFFFHPKMPPKEPEDECKLNPRLCMTTRPVMTTMPLPCPPKPTFPSIDKQKEYCSTRKGCRTDGDCIEPYRCCNAGCPTLTCLLDRQEGMAENRTSQAVMYWKYAPVSLIIKGLKLRVNETVRIAQLPPDVHVAIREVARCNASQVMNLFHHVQTFFGPGNITKQIPETMTFSFSGETFTKPTIDGNIGQLGKRTKREIPTLDKVKEELTKIFTGQIEPEFTKDVRNLKEGDEISVKQDLCGVVTLMPKDAKSHGMFTVHVTTGDGEGALNHTVSILVPPSSNQATYKFKKVPPFKLPEDGSVEVNLTSVVEVIDEDKLNNQARLDSKVVPLLGEADAAMIDQYVKMLGTRKDKEEAMLLVGPTDIPTSYKDINGTFTVAGRRLAQKVFTPVGARSIITLRPTKDFTGIIRLTVRPYLKDTFQNPFQFPKPWDISGNLTVLEFQVQDQNDAPVMRPKTQLEILTGNSPKTPQDLLVPFEPSKNKGIMVKDLVATFFEDSDDDGRGTGMAVLVAQESVKGKFQYQSPGGNWVDIVTELQKVPRFTQSNIKKLTGEYPEDIFSLNSVHKVMEYNINVTALLLPPNYRIRYNSSGGVWRISESYQYTNLFFTAWDMSDNKTARSNVSLPQPICLPPACGDSSAYGIGIISLVIHRLGCDGRIGSVAQVDRCGVCGGVDKCVDCSGTIKGGAKYDRCGNCTGGNTGVKPGAFADCAGNCERQYEMGAHLCLKKGVDESAIIKKRFCDGVFGSDKIISVCGICSSDKNAGKDKCGTCQGSNKCVDCAGVPWGGKISDACGKCLSPKDSNFNKGCSALGQTSPKVVYLTAGKAATVYVSTSADFLKTFTVKSCKLKGTNVDLNVVSETRNNEDQLRGLIANNTAAGKYKITCVLQDSAGSEVTKETSEDVTVVSPVVVKSLSKVSMNLKEKNVKINVTGAGFVDTGFVECFAKCPPKLEARECVSKLPLIRFPATRFSDTLVECDFGRAAGVQQAITAQVGVIVGMPEPGDISHLSTTTFSINAPKPVLRNAVLDAKSPCKVLMEFDINVETSKSIRNAGKNKFEYTCSDLLDSSTTGKIGTGASCRIYGKRMVILLGSSATLKSGDAITLASNAIASRNADTPNYATGGVNLQTPSGMSIPTPILVGPPEVGSCNPFRMRAFNIRKAQCDTLRFNWTVEIAAGQNTTGSNANSSVATLQTRLNSITDKRLLEIAGNELTPGFSYVFKVWVSNRLGLESQVSEYTVTRSASVKALTVSLIGGNRKDVDSTVRQTLFARTVLSKCANVSLDTTQFLWEAKSDTGQTVTVRKLGKRAVIIPDGYMLGGRKYTFTVTVAINNDFTNQISASVEWETRQQDLEAEIAGPKLSEADVEKDLILDASTSIDPNNEGGVYDENTAFSWGCKVLDEVSLTETGECIVKSNNTYVNLQSILDTTAQVTLAPNTLNVGLYMFTVTMRNGQRTSTDWVAKWVKKYEANFPLPVVKFIGEGNKKKHPKRPLKIRAVIDYPGEADTVSLSWQSVQEDGYSLIDLENCVKKHTMVRNGGNLRNYKVTLTYKQDNLEDCYLCPACTYKVRLVITISHSGLASDLLSSVETEFETYGAPAEGDFGLSSLNGTAIQDKITLTSQNWDMSSVSTNAFKCESAETQIKECKRLGLPTTSDTKELTLPAGTHYIRGVACSSVGICTESSTYEVVMNELQDPTSLLALMEDVEGESQIGADVSGFLQATTQLTASINDSSLLAQIKAKRDTLLADMLINVDTSDKESALDYLESTGDIPLSESNRQATLQMVTDVTSTMTKDTATSSSSSSSSRRKRAVSSQTELNSFEVSEVETLLNGFKATVNESSARSDVETYLAAIDTYTKGICRSMGTGMTLYATDDKYISMKMDMRLFDDVFNTSLNVACENCTAIKNTATVELGESMQDQFTTWNCTNELTCYGGCLATSQLPNNIISINTTALSPLTKNIRSDVIGVRFINPETNKYEETVVFSMLHVTGLSKPMKIKIPVTGEVNTTIKSLQCHKWSYVDDWTTTDCTSSDPFEENGVNYVTCSCTSLGFVAVFEGDPVSETTTTTEAPTTEAATTTTPVATTKSSHPNDVAPKVEVTFKLDANYSDVVGNNKSEFLVSLKSQLATKLGVDGTRIQNLDVKSGSIIVTFDLLPPTGASTVLSSAVMNVLTTAIANGTLAIKDLSGNTLSTVPGSLVVVATAVTTAAPTTAQPVATKAPAGVHIGIIIGAAVGGVLVLILTVVIAIVVCSKLKKNKRVGSSSMDDRSRQSLQETAMEPQTADEPAAYNTINETAVDNRSQTSLKSNSSGKGRVMATSHSGHQD